MIPDIDKWTVDRVFDALRDGDITEASAREGLKALLDAARAEVTRLAEVHDLTLRAMDDARPSGPRWPNGTGPDPDAPYAARPSEEGQEIRELRAYEQGFADRGRAFGEVDVEKVASVLTRWAEISPAQTSILPTPEWFVAQYAALDGRQTGRQWDEARRKFREETGL